MTMRWLLQTAEAVCLSLSAEAEALTPLLPKYSQAIPSHPKTSQEKRRSLNIPGAQEYKNCFYRCASTRS